MKRIGQSAAKGIIMYSEDIIRKINNGDIVSRRQLYAETGGRNPKKIQWLNEHGLLMPTKLTAEDVLRHIRGFYNEHGRIPKASEVPAGIVGAGQKYFGTWNDTLAEAVGEVNQKRYDHISNEDMLLIVRSFVLCHQRLPMREEFDGVNYPYFEAYFLRFGVRGWSDVIALVDLADVKYFAKHGWGNFIVYRGKSYLSSEEYLIGRYLSDREILFEKEVPYGNANFVFDFYIPSLDLYVEYYGISTADYQNNVAVKRDHYNGRNVLEIFKHDNTVNKLDSEVQRLHLLLAA